MVPKRRREYLFWVYLFLALIIEGIYRLYLKSLGPLKILDNIRKENHVIRK